MKRGAVLLNHVACVLVGPLRRRLRGHEVLHGRDGPGLARRAPVAAAHAEGPRPDRAAPDLRARPRLQLHALKKLQGGEDPGRASGSGLLGLAAPLVLTGPLIQVLTGDAARQWTGWIHAALGVVYVLAYVAHLLKKRPGDA